ncbi:MAG TPA: hypothetical protein VFA26_11265 [Gemmataceae bacterium]|nr:hypothetical protein [Gemmataceae bacterium]
MSPPLYRNPAVRRGLNLTERQHNQLNDTCSRLQEQYRNDISGLGRLRDRERAARAAPRQL